MRKFKLTIEYDGTRYCGWQVQPNGPTIQDVLEKSLATITKEPVTVVGAGRTDSGVHAEGQVAHFVTPSKMTAFQFQKALNSILPHDIAVIGVEEVAAEFDARRSARRKIYRYTILNRQHPSALNYSRSWFIPQKLDVEAMQTASRCLVGCHDFLAFQAGDADTRTSVRELFRIDFARDGDYIRITFDGSGFLKYMVRNIVGTLVEVGKGFMSADAVRAVLESRDRKRAGPTAQPQGLCLVRVLYEDEARLSGDAS